jgi:peptide-methionine (S)-S-oxide reductase
MAPRSAALAFFLLLAACDSAPAVQASETVTLAPPAQVSAQEPSGPQQAVFAGGCFWGVEAVFSHVKGVSSAVSGYHGGTANTAHYDEVGEGTTGHAEAVRITYDPAQVRYDDLLRIFFSVVIDPTQTDGQGPDHGPQYRAALVPVNAEQQRVASAYLAQLGAAKLWRGRITTRIEPYRAFYAAEAYHQDFMVHNPKHPYITYWDVPKVEALKKLFAATYKADFTPR